MPRGPRFVFQNRFKSILIESYPYFRRISQYIYLNPVKAGLIKDPIIYPYSSIREVLGKEPHFFLDEDIIRLIGETEGSRKEYEKFIYEGLSEDLSEIGKLFEKEQVVIGTNKFATFAQKKYVRGRNKKNA